MKRAVIKKARDTVASIDLSLINTLHAQMTIDALARSVGCNYHKEALFKSLPTTSGRAKTEEQRYREHETAEVRLAS